MIFHLSQVDSQANIVIRTVDTDVLLIAHGCMHLFHVRKKVWMETGIYTKNTWRYIIINKIFEFSGEEFCKALPGLREFTGFCYTTSFNQKGKSKALKILQKNENLQRVFIKLGNWSNINDLDITILESFVCVLYGKKKHTSIDEARFEMFLEKYKPTKNNHFLISHMKEMDASSMPSCSKVFLQKIKRTSYVTRFSTGLASRRCSNQHS